MAEFPVPTLDQIEPMLPGAFVGAAAAIGASYCRPFVARTLLGAAAVVAPWWVTWAVTHGGSIPSSTTTTDGRAGLAILAVALVSMVLPTTGRKSLAGLPARFLIFCAALGAALWTFLDPEHSYHVSTSMLATMGAIALIASAPAALSRDRIGQFATGSIVSSATGALGLILVAWSSAAALSQVVAATSFAAGLVAPFGRLRGSSGVPANVFAGWVGVAAVAAISADHTADHALPGLVITLIVLAVALPSAISLRGEKARSLVMTILAIALAAGLSGGAMLATQKLQPEPEAEEEADPYADFQLYK